jgi:hypothetical protein
MTSAMREEEESSTPKQSGQRFGTGRAGASEFSSLRGLKRPSSCSYRPFKLNFKGPFIRGEGWWWSRLLTVETTLYPPLSSPRVAGSMGGDRPAVTKDANPLRLTALLNCTDHSRSAGLPPRSP